MQVRGNPYSLVKSTGFPVDLYPFQQDAVNDLAPLPRSALYFDPGCGKTYTSLAMAQYKLIRSHCDTVLVIVPPVLLINWARNIGRIPGATHVVYAGTPVQRKRINLNVNYIIVGVQIFKKDFAHITASLCNKAVFGIVDEAQMLKNVTSDNYKRVSEFFMTNQICLLTGTPMSTPPDTYALIKLVTPEVYKTFYQWSSIHIEEVDFFKRPVKYKNLDLLSKNLTLCASRVIKEDVLTDLPEVTLTELTYDLSPEHLKLYRTLADEQLVKLESGDKIDLTSTSALWNALSQVPANAEHFSSGKINSSVLDLIEQVIDELGGKKLVLFCHYRMTTRRLLERFAEHNPACVYGETKDRQAEIDRFINNETCRVIVLQLQAGAAGVDGLQDVCCDAMFVELPYMASTFRQAIARLHREGQKLPVNIRVCVAQRTLQKKTWDVVMERDSLTNLVIRGPKSIRESIYGE